MMKAPAASEPAELDAALDGLDSYHWIIFTSANAIKFFFDRLRDRGMDIRSLHANKICVVGPKTAEALQLHSLKADLVPQEFKAEGVLAALGGEGVKGMRFLVPRAKIARELIPEKLRERGAEVTVATAYENVRPATDVDRVVGFHQEQR